MENYNVMKNDRSRNALKIQPPKTACVLWLVGAATALLARLITLSFSFAYVAYHPEYFVGDSSLDLFKLFFAPMLTPLLFSAFYVAISIFIMITAMRTLRGKPVYILTNTVIFIITLLMLTQTSFYLFFSQYYLNASLIQVTAFDYVYYFSIDLLNILVLLSRFAVALGCIFTFLRLHVDLAGENKFLHRSLLCGLLAVVLLFTGGFGVRGGFSIALRNYIQILSEANTNGRYLRVTDAAEFPVLLVILAFLAVYYMIKSHGKQIKNKAINCFPIVFGVLFFLGIAYEVNRRLFPTENSRTNSGFPFGFTVATLFLIAAAVLLIVSWAQGRKNQPD